jgi:Skp family chaperone for outer membrane proteins
MTAQSTIALEIITLLGGSEGGSRPLPGIRPQCILSAVTYRAGDFIVLEHGAFVALGLLVIWVVLLIPLARGILKATPFGLASMFLALMIPFFWLGPEITELTTLKVGSFKTNAEQASKYFDEIKAIRGKIDAEEKAISEAVASFDKELAASRAETQQLIRGKIDAEEKAISEAVASFDKELAASRAETQQLIQQRIQERLRDRTLTDEQVKSIAQYLQGFAGQEFRLVPYGGLPDSVSIGERIRAALTMANWKFIPLTGIDLLLPVEPKIVGVLVLVNPGADAKTKEAADALETALNNQRISTGFRLNSEIPENNIQVEPGANPVGIP